MSLVQNCSCSIDAAAVLLACKPEVIKVALENRDLVEILFKRIAYLEAEIANRDQLISKHCDDLKQIISQKYQYE